LQSSAAEGGAGANGLQVLGPQAWLVASFTDVPYAKGLRPERGKGDGVTEHRAAPGVHGAVDFNHGFPAAAMAPPAG